MTFGVCVYSLAGLLIPIRLWVCLHVSVISSWRRMLGERELCVLPSGERVVWELSLEWALGEDTRFRKCAKGLFKAILIELIYL